MEDLAFLSAPGVHFSPSDEECIDILGSKIKGCQLGSHCCIDYCDLYSDNEPWKIFNKNVKQDFYVFTKLNNIKNSKKNIKRTAGTGTWSMQRSEEVKNRSGQVIGYKKLLIFELGRKGSTNNKTDGRWIMHEFSLIGQQCQDVLCKIRNKILDNVAPPLSLSQYRLLQEEIQECSSSDSVPKIRFDQYSKTDQKRRKIGPAGYVATQQGTEFGITCVQRMTVADASMAQTNVGFDTTINMSQLSSSSWIQGNGFEGFDCQQDLLFPMDCLSGLPIPGLEPATDEFQIPSFDSRNIMSLEDPSAHSLLLMPPSQSSVLPTEDTSGPSQDEQLINQATSLLSQLVPWMRSLIH